MIKPDWSNLTSVPVDRTMKSIAEGWGIDPDEVTKSKSLSEDDLKYGREAFTVANHAGRSTCVYAGLNDGDDIPEAEFEVIDSRPLPDHA